MQPDDRSVAVIELRATLVVRGVLVRLEVPVGDGARVVGVRFVHMRGRKGSGQGDQRRQRQTQAKAVERMRHAP